jgi:hypothetical protein
MGLRQQTPPGEYPGERRLDFGKTNNSRGNLQLGKNFSDGKNYLSCKLDAHKILRKKNLHQNYSGVSFLQVFFRLLKHLRFVVVHP